MSEVNAYQAELAKFSALAHQWWDLDGEFAALHQINPLRLDWIDSTCPLKGARVLDVGCGGGILADAMARRGADVLGIDLAEKSLKVAQLHALETQTPHLRYRLVSAEALGEEMPAAFDVVTCMEMLEHVPDPSAIIAACASLLKPGGQLFLSTLNRTPAAFALAIVGAEYVARLLPKGTHQYQDFIKPAELAAWLRAADLQLQDVSGLAYEPWRNGARLISRTDVNYLASASKPA